MCSLSAHLCPRDESLARDLARRFLAACNTLVESFGVDVCIGFEGGPSSNHDGDEAISVRILRCPVLLLLLRNFHRGVAFS